MAKRLSDAELVERVRHGNRYRAEKRRQRLLEAGCIQMVIWVPTELRRHLGITAAERGQTLSETASALLESALDRTRVSAPAPRSASQPEPPAEALPSRQAAALLGFKSPASLDRAVSNTGYQIGFVKDGQAGSGKRAVFLGKQRVGAGPERNLWRVERQETQLFQREGRLGLKQKRNRPLGT